LCPVFRHRPFGYLLQETHRNAVEAPFRRLGTQALSLDVPPQRHHALRRDVDVRIRLFSNMSASAGSPTIGGRRTSAVSNTLMTPGCRSVRSFFRAFLARGRADRLAETSKEKMLQFEPSSCGAKGQPGPRKHSDRNSVTRGAILVGCRCTRSRWKGRGRPCRRRCRGTAGPWPSPRRQPT
jgi:hypothetical protein